MNNNLPSYYENLARRKVLKRSLLGRILLGIEGTKQRNWAALYLLALPVDAVVVVGKRIRWLLPVYDRAFVSSSLCLLAMAFALDFWPNVRYEVLLFYPLYVIVGVAYVASVGRIFVSLYRGKSLDS